MARHWWRNSAVREMNLRSYRVWNMPAFQEFPADGTSGAYFERYNAHYTIWRFVNVDENLNTERRSFPMVDHAVAVVGVDLANRTNDAAGNGIDHPWLDSGHRQPREKSSSTVDDHRFTFVS